MASVAKPEPRKRRRALDPDGYERVLASGSAVVLVIVLVALGRGYAEWGKVPLPIWLHLATMMTGLALTPVMLLRGRGDRLHRRLGWVWSVALVFTAVDSFLIRTIRPGSLSIIHVLSALVLIQVPMLVLAARRHDLKRHRATVRAMITGALLIAGVFTLMPSRLLGHWLLG